MTRIYRIKKRLASGNAKVFPHGTFKKQRNISLQHKLHDRNETELLHFARGESCAKPAAMDARRNSPN